jgi:hypothetical protein
MMGEHAIKGNGGNPVLALVLFYHDVNGFCSPGYCAATGPKQELLMD